MMDAIVITQPGQAATLQRPIPRPQKGSPSQ